MSETRAPNTIGNFTLPPIDQVGYVVSDLDKTLQQFETVYGPFTHLDSPLEGVNYRGTPTDCHLRIAFGKSGDIEMEFIEVVSGSSPHSEFLEAGHEGVHHVRYRIDNLDGLLPEVTAAGFDIIWQHDMGFAKWAYIEHPGNKGLVLEFLQM